MPANRLEPRVGQLQRRSEVRTPGALDGADSDDRSSVDLRRAADCLNGDRLFAQTGLIEKERVRDVSRIGDGVPESGAIGRDDRTTASRS